MEVCGTHTVSIFKSGIKSLLPPELKLVSGPGCPVCVTPDEDIDNILFLSTLPGVTITSFGDMVRVPGKRGSLEKIKSEGGRVRVVYSPLESLHLAKKNPREKVIFFGVGFETTTPLVGWTIFRAKEEGVKNFWVYSSHKLIPPAMEVLAQDKGIKLEGFICPGHVSTIIGSSPYRVIAEKYGLPCVISGFEPKDILESILMLLKQIKEKKSRVEIQYKRVVRPEGNPWAKEVLERVFEVEDAKWRGLGLIPRSGLRIKEEFEEFDAKKKFSFPPSPKEKRKGCLCGEVLKGKIDPPSCPQFGKGCTPERPLGPCMVSFEGTCSAWYKWGDEFKL